MVIKSDFGVPNPATSPFPFISAPHLPFSSPAALASLSLSSPDRPSHRLRHRREQSAASVPPGACCNTSFVSFFVPLRLPPLALRAKGLAQVIIFPFTGSLPPLHRPSPVDRRPPPLLRLLVPHA
ncbi:hypothetical protein QR680_013500 [Steinernema hermaphroditum]|uniref:Uncharacterized protein n=1 Tax=Steinernema hermaphroditum TaxID=289476 RepID=A0AA39M2L5_9BILA|nr:hypothetical protein QR680_013500 [Steinernema hermaphroditum]